MSELDRDPFEAAAKEGLAVFIGSARLLLVDLDSDEAWDHFRTQVQRLGEDGWVAEVLVTTSKSGNRHAYCWLAEPIPDEGLRLALQAGLGSDCVRELLSCLRVLGDKDRPASVLFETEQEALKVQAWLDGLQTPAKERWRKEAAMETREDRL